MAAQTLPDWMSPGRGERGSPNAIAERGVEEGQEMVGEERLSGIERRQ